MPATTPRPQPAGTAPVDRRARVIRELKLALVERLEQGQSAGFDPYDARQGRGHTPRWETRRR